MAYVKNNWVDREGVTRYFETVDDDGALIFTPDYTQVTELGTPVNADNMNHIEEGIAAGSFTKYDSMATYAKNDLVTIIVDNNLKVYKSLQDDNTNALDDSSFWEEVEFSGGGSSRNIGELVTSLLPQTDAGLHLVDGALINGGGAYADFVNYIAKLYNADPTANYFTDEETWQTSVTNYGVCGKFVYDNVANTVRLPKVTGIIEGTIDANALGDLVEAGLPPHTHTRGTMNITGAFGFEAWSSFAIGAFYKPGTGAKKEGTGIDNGSTGADTNFDASRSWTGETSQPTNEIYGKSDTVQPQTIKGFVYICIATSKKTDVEVNIDNVMTDLNGKADTDLTNLTNTGKDFASSLSMPSGRYIDLTLGASGSTYTAPANGYFAIHCQNKSATDWGVIFQIKEKKMCSSASRYFQGASALTNICCQKGDVVTLYYDGTLNTANPYWFTFVYAEGVE